MDCEKCLKAHATIHLMYIDGCRKKELHLCAACAATLDLRFPLAPTLRPDQPPPP